MHWQKVRVRMTRSEEDPFATDRIWSGAGVRAENETEGTKLGPNCDKHMIAIYKNFRIY